MSPADVSAAFFKIRGEGLVRNKAVYIAPGVAPDGTKDTKTSRDLATRPKR
jgi:hypothetical protein